MTVPDPPPPLVVMQTPFTEKQPVPRSMPFANVEVAVLVETKEPYNVVVPVTCKVEDALTRPEKSE